MLSVTDMNSECAQGNAWWQAQISVLYDVAAVHVIAL